MNLPSAIVEAFDGMRKYGYYAREVNPIFDIISIELLMQKDATPMDRLLEINKIHEVIYIYTKYRIINDFEKRYIESAY
jgi:hypothetical protein